ncbi:helix-turn-helix transcriptional regulator [Acholeplasma laidlawii]|uniref:helix-turn-helix transcriptional regulator n=1 Tax=Acholeplasma laidlawii TaxID=2148 RepID=UPI0021F7EE01|nr:helix-turn-helix transcriptional regulator [Acholeplasma laidlawii]
MSLYLKLKEIREKKGMSQEELAEKLGINRTMIIHYEKGRNYPSLERAVQISNILGCTLDELVDTKRYLDEYQDMLYNLNNK